MWLCSRPVCDPPLNVAVLTRPVCDPPLNVAVLTRPVCDPPLEQSISEKVIDVYADKCKRDRVTLRAWQRQLRKQLGRAYPRATRVASDNYDPLSVWSMGLHMAALNYQTNDVGMQLNRAFFRRGGGTGYVPKPVEMRGANGGALSRAAAPHAPLPEGVVAPAGAAASNAPNAPNASAESVAHVPPASGVAVSATAGGGATMDGCDDDCWPPQRKELCLLNLRLVALYHLPTRGERRPTLDSSSHHQYVPELSGAAVPPSVGTISLPRLEVSCHPIGGFGAVAPSLDALKRVGGTMFAQRLRTPTSSAAGGGLCAVFDAPAHCLVAEPMEALLRVAVLDGEVEVAYEVVVAGAVRDGYRCLPLREPASGTLIDGCTLLLHVERASAPHAWIDDHDQLRETIARQKAQLDDQTTTIARLTRELADARQAPADAEWVVPPPPPARKSRCARRPPEATAGGAEPG
jgi:hypothetical protein